MLLVLSSETSFPTSRQLAGSKPDLSSRREFGRQDEVAVVRGVVHHDAKQYAGCDGLKRT